MTKHSTLRALVDQAALKIDAERPERYFARLWPFAVSGLQELTLAGAGGHSVKTILLDLGPDRIATLPDDFVDWAAVGQEYADAAGTMRVRQLAYGPTLSTTAPVEPFLDPAPLSTPVDTAAWPCYDYWGYAGGALCGYGWGEYRQEFTIDPKERVLRASSLIDAALPLVFQYIAADERLTTETPVHPYLHRPLECWVLSEWWSHKQNWTAAAKWEKAYHGAKAAMKARFDPTTMAGITAALHEAFRQTPH